MFYRQNIPQFMSEPCQVNNFMSENLGYFIYSEIQQKRLPPMGFRFHQWIKSICLTIDSYYIGILETIE